MSGRHGWSGPRPPWWPETEAWPPTGRERWAGGPWGWGRGGPGRRRPPIAWRIGCALVFLVGVGALLMAAAAWVWAGLSGAGAGVGVVVGLIVLGLVIAAIASGTRWLRGLAEPVDDLVAAHLGEPDATNLDPVFRNFGHAPRRTNSAIPRTFSPIEVAAFDLTGRSLGVPVAEKVAEYRGLFRS